MDQSKSLNRQFTAGGLDWASAFHKISIRPTLAYGQTCFIFKHRESFPRDSSTSSSSMPYFFLILRCFVSPPHWYFSYINSMSKPKSTLNQNPWPWNPQQNVSFLLEISSHPSISKAMAEMIETVIWRAGPAQHC